MNRLLSILITFFYALSVQAAGEVPEIPKPGKKQADTIPMFMHEIPLTSPDFSASTLTMQQMYQLESLRQVIEMPSLFTPNDGYATSEPSRFFTAPGIAGFHLWNGGDVYFTGGDMSLPGLMGIEQGSVNFTQTIGRLSINAFASANHYGYFRGLQTSYGFGGSASYQLTDRISLTVFGAYYSSPTPLNPSMAAYINGSNFGGYASFDLNEHWGISVGAQTTRSTVTNRWEAQPIVKPYYRFNRNVAFGVDMGGILYNLIKSNRRGYGRSNPTIGPPVGGPPPVAPRR